MSHSTQRTSHPVGTTVRISDLFKHIPVRRQTALKNSAKTLAKVKKMIQTYAMCNPSKRFSLKVLKARAENVNWMYAAQDGTLMDAALKIAGHDVASNCVERQWPDEPDHEEQAEIHSSGFRLVSLLPTPDCGMYSLFGLDVADQVDFTKMNNFGQYLSIDGRPVSTTRGIGQDIAKLYKTYIRAAASRQDTSATTTDPFLCLQICCPEASYDVNIEPAKDDVLFEAPHEVLALVEGLFQFTYGEREAPKEKRASKEKQAVRANGSFDLLLARRDEDESIPTREGNDSRPQAAIHSNAYISGHPAPAERNSQVRDSSDSEASLSTSIQTRTSKEGLNPWSLTSFNVPTQRRGNATLNGNGPRITKYVPGRGFREWSQGSRETNRRGSATSILPSPSASSPECSSRSVAESPSSAARFHVPRVSGSQTPSQVRLQKGQNGEHHNNAVLDEWFGRSIEISFENSHSQTTTDASQEPSLTQLARRRFEQSPSNERPTSPIASSAGPSGRTREASISSDATSINHNATEEGMNIPRQEQGNPLAPEGWSTGLDQLSQSNVSALEGALDFERRKKEAIQKRREQIRNTGNSTKSPHHSRYLAARAALASQPEIPDHPENERMPNVRSTNSETRDLPASATPKMGPFDPRSYLMRRRSSHLQASNGNKLRRINTSKLPLETIPNGEEMHDIGLEQPLDIPSVSKGFKSLLTTDLYTESGREDEAFKATQPDSELLELWEHRLHPLISINYRTDEGARVSNMQFDFTALTQR